MEESLLRYKNYPPDAEDFLYPDKKLYTLPDHFYKGKYGLDTLSDHLYKGKNVLNTLPDLDLRYIYFYFKN